MKKAGTDPKVKKTLLRNYEQKVRSDRKPAVVAVSGGSSKEISCFRGKDLDHPTLCSSEALATYLTDVKKSVPPPLSEENIKHSQSQLSAKITKKLNFHFNDRIYKNLVELNTDVAKNKKDKKTKSIPLKKDLEPSIEDFCHDEKEDDLIPNLPVLKHKFKLIKGVEDGQLHKLIASFELL